jgi:hypothetical protein
MKKIIFIIIVVLFSAISFAEEAHHSRGTLELQSSVPAGVWLNWQAVGNTPFTMELPEGLVIYSIRAPGHWTEVFMANIHNGVNFSHNVQLKQHGMPEREASNISHINNLQTLENLYDSVSKQQPATPDSLCLATFAADYPLPNSAPSPLDENSVEYKNYYQIYSHEKQLLFKEWYASCSGPVQQDMNAILARISELGKENVTGYVPIIAAEFEPTVPDGLKGDLTLYFYSPGRRAEVAWKGTWENDFLAGDDLVRALTASPSIAIAFLTTQNQTIWIPVESGYSRHFYKYSELNISWNGLLFPMEGKFFLPDYIMAQPEVVEWLAGGEVVVPEIIPQDTVVAEEQIPDRALLAKIPGGNFKYRGQDMEIKPFAMHTGEVSQSLYKDACGKKNFGKYKGDSLPAHSITWNEASGCCKTLGGELPTEAEWEYAARAGSPHARTWASSATASNYAVFDAKKPAKTAERKPNGWGLYDMFGNVAEWVKDDGFWFGKYKFMKGGSYKSKEGNLTTEDSEEEDARYWGTHTGFRCVFR